MEPEQCMNIINLAKAADNDDQIAANQILDIDFEEMYKAKINFNSAIEELTNFNSVKGYVLFLLAAIHQFSLNDSKQDWKTSVKYYHMIMDKYLNIANDEQWLKMKSIIETHLKRIDEYGYIFDLIKIEIDNCALEKEQLELENKLKEKELELLEKTYEPGGPGALAAKASFENVSNSYDTNTN